MSGLTDEASICLPLRKFVPNEHGLYLGYVLPNGPTDYAYKENIEKVKVYFWSKKSLLNSWFQCLTVRVRKKHQHLGCINEVASRFTFGSLNEEQLRCLFLTLGLRPAKYAVIRPRLFTLLDKNSEMQIYGLADENKKYTGLIVKSNHVENSVRHKLEVNESQISAKFKYSHTFSTDIKQKCHFFEVFQF